ncbi:MAG TPA: peptide ABC transporter substrate-binding protein [Candidatus Angelobacter sp.]|nr:peptide ABC transporter substrate-binding protein [Candidatus Angelobacter sp.]
MLISALVAGCMRRDPPADVTIINYAEPQSLDPAIISAQPDMRIVSGMFEGLTRTDPKTGSAIPGLAERWDISPDGRVYTFHLRTNLVWSTGEPIRAADVVYSWLRTLNPATASDYAGQLFYVKNAQAFNAGKIKDASQVGVKAPDPFTVRVELNNPTVFFLDVCAMPMAAVVPRQTIEKFGDSWIRAKPLPVSGAYELGFWRLNDKVRLIKNPRYWDAANTQSDIIDLLPIGSASSALNLYIRGQADVVWDKELVPTELLDVLLKRPDFHTFSYLGSYFIRVNVTRKPFNDPRVRQALALAIDKQRIVERITRGGEQPASHLVPNGTANYVSPEGLGYDPERARQLLAEAGFPGGKNFPRMEYMFNAPAGGGKIHEQIAIELQQMWRDNLGVDIELRQLEMQVYLTEQDAMHYDLSRSSWIGDYNDANTFLNMFVTDDGNNRTGWSNAHYDELIRKANQTTDIKAREKLFQEAETILVRDELPIIPLFFYQGINYFDTNKIQGIYNNIVDLHPLNAIKRVVQKNGPSQ